MAILRTTLAVGAGKLTAALSATFKLGTGTSLPGKVARKIDPNLLANLSRQIRNQVIAVTGTNGKTTTCGLLAQFLKEAGHSVVHNELGANMVPGITAALLKESSISKGINAEYGVLEIDEASLKGVAQEVAIQKVVVTNLFRDQLDRYGELDTTAKMIQAGIEKTAQQLILNADDPLVATMGITHPDALYFGVETVQYQYPPTLNCPVVFHKEVSQCPQCGGELSYTQILYGHLGNYQCQQCGYQRPKPAVIANLVEVFPDKSRVQLSIGEEQLTIELALPGLFNVYNLLAAISVLYSLGVSIQVIPKGLAHYHSVFGRAERKEIFGKSALIMLIKNPVGASEVLKLVGRDPNGRLLIAINDNYADGRDISWLWDASFEVITSPHPIIVSGNRAQDMAIRLKYAGIQDNQIICIPDLQQAIKSAAEATQATETLYILPTYTALLSLNSELSQFN